MVKVTYDRRQCLGTFIKYYDDEISEWAKNNNTYTTPKREVYELDEAFCSVSDRVAIYHLVFYLPDTQQRATQIYGVRS
jgi:hypothetical protein